MPNLGNKIKSLKSISGLSSSPKISLSALKKEKFKQTKKKYVENLQKVIQLKLIQLKLIIKLKLMRIFSAQKRRHNKRSFTAKKYSQKQQN